MNVQKKSTNGSTTIRAADVYNYLERYPDFFSDHSNLLAKLYIPHKNGKTISLLERQITILREQNQQMKKQIDNFIDNARKNESLMQQLHRLSLALIEAKSCKSIFSILDNFLKTRFNADQVVIRLFTDAKAMEDKKRNEFAGVSAPARKYFREYIEARKPYSSKVTAELRQQALLFDKMEDQISSMIMIPLYRKEWDGILAIGSIEAERFHANMGNELLINLGEFISLILTPWVKQP